VSEGRFLGSLDSGEGPEFRALSSQGSKTYFGMEVFPNPGCAYVTYTSDEVMAKCPITDQPDFYTVEIALRETDKLIESKSLKIWFQNLMFSSFGEEGIGIFCEALAVHIRDAVVSTVDTDTDHVQVTLVQKSRGGIVIKAIA
jgi:NADPH-dependent 7-cyano-7-deazaguanine reductase QueF